MYTLWYSIYGNSLWTRFHTGPDIWMSSGGFTMIDGFSFWDDAEATVREWFLYGKEYGRHHYPVAVFYGDKLVAIFDTEAWPYVLPASCRVVRVDGSEQMVVVVV